MEHALALNAKNCSTLWADKISKELGNIRVAFEILPYGKTTPIGYQFVQCHMVFDIKMADFRHKARTVVQGHMTKAPTTITYASIVSRETAMIALMIATLNDLEVKSHDILCIGTGPVAEKVSTTLDFEFSKIPERLQ